MFRRKPKKINPKQKPTVAGFTVSDKAASNAFTQASANGASQPCAGDRPPAPRKPCDIKDVVITHTSDVFEKQWKNKGTVWKPIWEAKAEEIKVRSVSILGGAAAPQNRYNKLQVVSFPKGENRVAKVSVTISPFAVAHEKHVFYLISRPDEADITGTCSADEKKDFEVYSCQVATSRLGRIFERFWTYGHAVNHYWIAASSCGFRDSGTPIHSARMSIEVFTGDQVKITLKIPPIGKYSYEKKFKGRKATLDKWKLGSEKVDESEHKLEVRAGGDMLKYSSSNDRVEKKSTESGELHLSDGTKYRSEEETDYSDGIPVVHETDSKPSTDLPSLQIQLNDKDVDVVADLNKLLKVIQSVKEAVAFIKELVKDWVPQIGFKFEFELEFFSGALAATWGYRNHSDYRVYFGFDLESAITIFRISLIASFGVKVGPFLGRVEGGIDDAKLEWKTTFKFNTPDRAFMPSFKNTLEIPFVLRGRAEASLCSFKVKREVGLKAGFGTSYEMGLVDDPDKFTMKAEVKWRGVDAYVTKKDSPLAGEESETWHLIDEKDVWDGTVPI